MEYFDSPSSVLNEVFSLINLSINSFDDAENLKIFKKPRRFWVQFCKNPSRSCRRSCRFVFSVLRSHCLGSSPGLTLRSSPGLTLLLPNGAVVCRRLSFLRLGFWSPAGSSVGGFQFYVRQGGDRKRSVLLPFADCFADQVLFRLWFLLVTVVDLGGGQLKKSSRKGRETMMTIANGDSSGSDKKKALSKLDFTDLVLSWSLQDILNENLYKNQVSFFFPYHSTMH
ncbi:hypothetical protein RHGRI_017954 [Rhododendron griersonianum]|uniref:Uncharacterized protein n=1 Tax=Rhododendron griersonianum TaxID=479676 RepID=A0AAV6JZQ5_9ERIC|nr:hypothetical protein RHGRI_017954 [Rhododendron griersonianum]